jgi:hypothetical protein
VEPSIVAELIHVVDNKTGAGSDKQITEQDCVHAAESEGWARAKHQDDT